MNIWYSLLAGAFLTTALHAETIVDKNAEKGVDLSGRITISDDAASGKRSYKAGRTELSVKEYIHLDPDYTYTISLKYKAADNNTAFIHVGVHPFDSAGRSISASNVAASNDTITRLLKPARKGDTVIYVHNATKWRNVPGRVAAFFAAADLSDIPNRNISGAIESIECNTVNGDVIRFKKPLTFDVPAGTLVRQHASAGPYHYVFSRSVKPGKWETWTSAPLTAANLRHAAKVRLVIVANAHGTAAKGTLLVDDIKVERHKKTAPAAPAAGQPDEGTLAFFDAENGSSGLSGKITIAGEGAASGHSFRAGRTEVSVSKLIQIEDDAKYRFSAKFKPGNGKRCIVHLGVHPFDVSGRSIPAIWVSPVANSMTEVVQDAKKGDKSIVVRSAARWSKRAGAVVAFSVAEDLSDLPNRIVSGAITDIRQVSDGYVVEFKTPLNFDVPAGTAVRQHLSGGFYHYLRVRDFKPGSDWTEVATDFLASKNLRYASAVRLVLVINAEKSALESELLIDDIKVEKKKINPTAK